MVALNISYFQGKNMKTLHRILIGNSRNMSDIHDESVHLIITSPPYWQLKDYGNCQPRLKKN